MNKSFITIIFFVAAISVNLKATEGALNLDKLAEGVENFLAAKETLSEARTELATPVSLSDQASLWGKEDGVLGNISLKDIQDHGITIGQLIEIQKRRYVLFPDNFRNPAPVQVVEPQVVPLALDCRNFKVFNVLGQGWEIAKLICAHKAAGWFNRASNKEVARLQDLIGKIEPRGAANGLALSEKLNSINTQISKLDIIKFTTDQSHGIPDFTPCGIYNDCKGWEINKWFFDTWIDRLGRIHRDLSAAEIGKGLQEIIDALAVQINALETRDDLISDLSVCREGIKDVLKSEQEISTWLNQAEAYSKFETECSPLREHFCEQSFPGQDLLTAVLSDRISKVALSEWLEDILKYGPTFSKFINVELSHAATIALGLHIGKNENPTLVLKQMAQWLFERANGSHPANQAIVMNLLKWSLTELNKMTLDKARNVKTGFALKNIDNSYRITFLVYQYFLNAFKLDESSLKTIVMNRQLAKNGITLFEARKRLVSTVLTHLGSAKKTASAVKTTLANFNGKDLPDAFWQSLDFVKQVREWVKDNPLESETLISELKDLYDILTKGSGSSFDQAVNLGDSIWQRRNIRTVLRSLANPESVRIIDSDSDSMLSPELIALVDALPKIKNACGFIQGAKGNNLAGNVVGNVTGLFAPRFIAALLAGTAGLVQMALVPCAAERLPESDVADAGFAAAITLMRGGNLSGAFEHALRNSAIKKVASIIGTVGLRDAAALYVSSAFVSGQYLIFPLASLGFAYAMATSNQTTLHERFDERIHEVPRNVEWWELGPSLEEQEACENYYSNAH